MRILHVVEACSAGVGKHVIDLVPNQAALGVKVDLVYSRGRVDTYFEHGLKSLPDTVSCFLVHMEREIGPVQDLRALRQLYQIIRAGSYDVVHAHSSKAGVLARLACSLPGAPLCVYTPHSISIQPTVPLGKRALYWSIEKVMGYLTDITVAVSHQEADELRRLRVCPRQSIAVVHNGIDVKQVSSVECGSVRDELGVSPQTGLVVGVGRLSPQKDPATFVRVAEQVVRVCPDVMFVWAGDGELMSEIRKTVHTLGLNEHVRFVGYRSDVPTLLAAADLYLHTARYEGLPYSLMEALGLQTAAVSTEVAGARDLLGEDGERCIAPVGDVAGLVHKTLEMLRHPELREQVSARGATRIRELFAVDVMAKNLISSYQQGLSRKRTRYATHGG